MTTIAGVHLNLPRYDRRAVDGLWLGRAEVDAAITRLRAMSYAERAANACIGHERADLVLAGCAILEAIRNTFPRRAAAHRRSGPARGNPQSHDARRRGRSAPPPARALVTTGGSGREGGRALKTRVKMTRKRTPARPAGSSASSTTLTSPRRGAKAIARARLTSSSRSTTGTSS